MRGSGKRKGGSRMRGIGGGGVMDLQSDRRT